MRLKVDLVAAARPNFMKVAPLYKALEKQRGWCETRLIHTGQHYDGNMSAAFFQDFGLPEPDLHLGVGSGTHAEQTAGVLVGYEKVCRESAPDWVIVVGDVNSTLACTLAACKLGIRVAHLEAGLRSGDRSMPEEINRVLTDNVADLLWTPSSDADENLLREGVSPERICRVGNIMIDSLEMLRSAIEQKRYFEVLGMEPQKYGVMTLHRPSNVDDPKQLDRIVQAVMRATTRCPIVFTVHPRTRERLMRYKMWERLIAGSDILTLDPLGYIDFMSLVFNSSFVVTDSGGIQEETTYLGIPCLTLRENTERPVTVSIGTNRLITSEGLGDALTSVLDGKWPKGRIPELWDGRAASRVAASLRELYQ